MTFKSDNFVGGAKFNYNKNRYLLLQPSKVILDTKNLPIGFM